MKAKFKKIYKKCDTKEWEAVIAFENDFIIEVFEDLKDDILDVDIQKAYDGRGLNANRYYWKLCNMLAGATQTSNQEMHNLLLRSYGAFKIKNGCPVQAMVLDTDAEEEKILKSMKYHMMPTSEVYEKEDGNTYRIYNVLKASHELSSAEMARLIDGAIYECEAAGVPVLPKKEIKRLIEKWKN